MNNMKNLISVWNQYYDENDDTALKDKNFFKLEIETIIENILSHVHFFQKPVKILELGSGTGYLAFVISNVLRKKNIQFDYVGIDFSDQAIKKSKRRQLENCLFTKSDFNKFLKNNGTKFDYIITQRSIIAIMDKKEQEELLIEIKNSMHKNSIGLFSEITTQAFEQIQELRKKLGVKPLDKVWHSLYLDETLVSDIFSRITVKDFSSTYWLITRVIYPFFAEPKHNSKIHDFAAKLDQNGKHGLVKLFVARI